MTDQSALRKALGQFATGVSVITAQDANGALIGLTMSSFNSVSLDPPLILFSIARSAKSVDAILNAEGYAVNLLSKGQEELSNQFARTLTDKWINVEHSAGHAKAPLLHGAIAHFECAPYGKYDGGDHVIVVGRVLRFTYNPELAPLIFFRGKYHSLADDERAPEWPLPIHYW